MKRRTAIGAAVVALLGVIGAYVWSPSKTPPLQKPLSALSSANFKEFEAAFDEPLDAPRLVLLLSPT